MPSAFLRSSSINLIRSFVVVGRRMSITLAAQDLCVTQSAVSRQIFALEEILGVKLLVRGHRSITFTPEGGRLFRVADGAVQQLQNVVDEIHVPDTRQPVTITCTIGFASLWLLPRLGGFQHDHPGLDVRIAATTKVEDLRGEGIDLAIRYCAEETASAGAERLFGEMVAPVAHRTFVPHSLDSARTLERQVLLELDGQDRPWLHWQDWLASQGWRTAKPKGTLRFNHYDQIISAAIEGRGIALGRLKLLGPMLSDGRLRILTTPRAGPSTSYAYWLIRAKPKPRQDVLTMADWILSQAEATDSCNRL